MTCREVTALREETLEKLLVFNRELKINYAAIKENVKQAKDLQGRQSREFAQGKH